MKEIKDLSAKEAFSNASVVQTQIYNSPKLQRIYNRILKRIRKASERGYYEIEIPNFYTKPFYKVLTDKLHENGFRIYGCHEDINIIIRW